MGLGKTVIGIAAAEKLFDEGKIDLCIVACPSSIKFQWEERIAEFTSGTCFVVDGTADKRKAILSFAKDKANYLVMSYDCIVRDSSILGPLISSKKCMVILDEATAIKTFKAQRTKTIKRLLKAEYRMALTGTPVENKPDELFSIMQWVDDSVLGKYHLFDKAYINRNKYGWVTSYKNLPVLRKKIAPAMSRKSRSDPLVKPYLPDVDEGNWYIEPDPKLMDIYKIISEDMLSELSKMTSFSEFSMDDYYRGVDESRAAGKLMAMYNSLEMLLDHPDLVVISAMKYEDASSEGSAYANHLWRSDHLDDLAYSTKLSFLLDKVEMILSDPDSKILIYSKYKEMVHIIHQALKYRGVRSVKFHGDFNASQRMLAVSMFANDYRVLVSSHAGAYGMDMKMANYLINYDLPWSSGTYDQINNRHVRASSEFDKVYVRNIITRGTVEERKLRILHRKLRIAGAILDGEGSDPYGRIDVEGDSLTKHLLSVLGKGL